MRCPACGTESPPEAQYCTNCGVPLKAQAGEELPVIYCTKCGTGNRRDVVLCGNCGASLKESPTPGVPSREFPRRGQRVEAVGRLVPRDLGDLVGETFRLYRGNFWAFVLIAIPPQIPFLVGELISNIALSFILIAVGISMTFLAHGAMAFAVGSLYLGENISVGECYRRAWSRVLSLISSGIVFWVPALLLALLTTVTTHIPPALTVLVIIIGFPLSLYLLVSWFSYAQAIMLEGRKGPRNSLRRSHELVRGSWWRVFGIGIVFFLIYVAAIIPGFIASEFSPIVGDVLISLAGAVVTPIVYIGATVVYIDLRVRKEGYTLEAMASEVGA